MAADASRRRLESGILSARIKLPNDNPHRFSEEQSSSSNMAPSMSNALQSTSPSMRRNHNKLAEAMQSMSNLNNSMESLDLPTDPDAQATVTDFLDFTEYLPSDMIRSLTLIGNLDHQYTAASLILNEQCKKYAELPSLPAHEKLDPITLRAELSQSITEAKGARESATHEAARMAENVDRHYNRAKNILAKLQDMMDKYPSSRETSPIAQKQKSPVASRQPKLTLTMGGTNAHKVRKHRAPRITVPGEVLAPYELDYESYGSDSDEEDEAITPRATPARALGTGMIKLTVRKDHKKKEKSIPRSQRPPGAMGTNVHSQVAGISTSNALALLKPPPADAPNGSDEKPWLCLTPWELANLRKRMKKNAVWSPSDTMIARELKILGRGPEAYYSEVAKYEAAGKEYDQPTPPQLKGETVHAEGALSVEALNANNTQATNRGMKLNEMKKKKMEALRAAEESESITQKMSQSLKSMKSLFDFGSKKGSAKTPNKTANQSATPARKRKREPSVSEIEIEKPAEAPPSKSTRPQIKRTKTETPIPVPQPIAKQATPASHVESTASVTSETAPSSTVGTPTTESHVPVPSSRKVATPILPPNRKGVKKEANKSEPGATPSANTRPRRNTKTPTPAPEAVALAAHLGKRPTSSRSNATELATTAITTVDRPRRSSTARNTPAPAEPRQINKRTKRPAPGPVASSTDGSASVSVGKRTAAPRKKAGPKKERREGTREGSASAAQQEYDEFDEEGNLIDPDEPRYCICNRVSFGMMIGCENNDCEKEWFHLECVGLVEIPPRTTKWYCPDCRITLGIGEKGEVTARGRKK